MQIVKTVFISTCFLLCSVVFSHSADIAKIGVIDFQKILELSDVGKASQSAINKQGKKMEAKLKAKQVELEDMKNRFEREILVMSKEKREEKEREFRIKMNDFKSLEKKFKVDFNQINSKLVNKIQKEIFKVVKEVGKKEGYLLIIERQEAGIYYFPKTIDITDKLVDILNDKFVEKDDKEKKVSE